MKPDVNSLHESKGKGFLPTLSLTLVAVRTGGRDLGALSGQWIKVKRKTLSCYTSNQWFLFTGEKSQEQGFQGDPAGSTDGLSKQGRLLLEMNFV